jgi:hydroxymethylbilane synthase
MRRRLLVGTRGSRLALAQTKLVVDMLKAIGGEVDYETVPIKTLGDTVPAEKLGDVDGKAAFTGDIDRRLAEGGIDISVHSMKDLPANLHEELVIAATPPRGEARDAFVSVTGQPLSEIRSGARVGTSSIRRKAQVLAARRDVVVVDLHGNVETRLRKMEEGMDGVVLASAGLQRLGLGSRVCQLFSVDEMVPAVSQGVLAVEARRDDGEVLSLIARIDDPATRAASECERGFSEELGGDCDVPLGAYAHVDSGRLSAVGMIADAEGREVVKDSVEGGLEDPRGLGRRLAAKVGNAGGRRILEELRA